MTLKRIVIKPTLECTACCPMCALRLTLHSRLRTGRTLDLKAWRDVISTALTLGCVKLDISGGEPTLYPQLAELVEMGVSAGMTTNLNTNGSRLTSDLLSSLVAAGLNSVTVSIYSTHAVVHDGMRNEEGLHCRALRGLQLALQAGLVVNWQSIMSRQNILELDLILKQAFEVGVSNLYLSYVEGDIDQRSLPSVSQIEQFKCSILPKMLLIAEERSPNQHRATVCRQLRHLFPGGPSRQRDFARGHYFARIRPACSRPDRFALVLANGDVHPCNGVEYCHDPVIGNICDSSLGTLWQSDRWRHFRESRHEWCHFCPMVLHLGIPVLPDPALCWPGEWGSDMQPPESLASTDE